MKYDFKTVEEIGWAMAVGSGIFIFELLSRFEPETVTDWKTWIVSVGGGLARAAFAAGLVAFRRGR